MKLQFFSVNALEPDEDQAELDSFCAQHRVVSTEKYLLEKGGFPYWAVCVTYLERNTSPGKARTLINKKAQVDYQAELSPADFAIYAKLRELRKGISEAEGVPAFALFTNVQLAAMVTRKIVTRTALAELEGVGDAKLEKYAKSFLTILQACLPTPQAPQPQAA